jgi:hypothetical protein
MYLYSEVEAVAKRVKVELEVAGKLNMQDLEIR